MREEGGFAAVEKKNLAPSEAIFRCDVTLANFSLFWKAFLAW